MSDFVHAKKPLKLYIISKTSGIEIAINTLDWLVFTIIRWAVTNLVNDRQKTATPSDIMQSHSNRVDIALDRWPEHSLLCGTAFSQCCCLCLQPPGSAAIAYTGADTQSGLIPWTTLSGRGGTHALDWVSASERPSVAERKQEKTISKRWRRGGGWGTGRKEKLIGGERSEFGGARGQRRYTPGGGRRLVQTMGWSKAGGGKLWPGGQTWPVKVFTPPAKLEENTWTVRKSWNSCISSMFPVSLQSGVTPWSFKDTSSVTTLFCVILRAH